MVTMTTEKGLRYLFFHFLIFFPQPSSQIWDPWTSPFKNNNQDKNMNLI